MHVSERPRTRRNIAIFTVVVLSVGWIGRLIDESAGAAAGEGPGLLLWILAPVLTGLILRGLAGDGWRDSGLRPNFRANWRWYLLSAGFYPVVLAVSALIGLWTGDVVAIGGGRLPMQGFISAFAIALVPSFMKNIGEEFGWRGYLVPRLDNMGVGRWGMHVIVGSIWAAWHLPYVSTFWTHTDEGMATLVPRFFLGTIIAAVVFGEIRLRTQSVWPAVLMHTAGSAFGGALLAENVLQMTSPTPDVFTPGVDGWAIIGLTLLAAVLVLRRQAAPLHPIARLNPEPELV